MLNAVLNLAAATIVACLTHEGGHWLAALCFGKRIRFWFEWGRLFGVVPVPRGVWNMPDMARWKQRITALAGFGTEFAGAVFTLSIGWAWLLLVAALHITAYPFYAGDANDFKWI